MAVHLGMAIAMVVVEEVAVGVDTVVVVAAVEEVDDIEGRFYWPLVSDGLAVCACVWMGLGVGLEILS